MKRKILSAVLGAVLTFGALTISASAGEIRSITAEQYLAAKLPTLINNIGMNNYYGWDRWAQPVTSYLTTADGGFMRVQADDQNSSILVEYYNNNFALKSSKTIKYELPLFGAFYETEDSYYILTGQENPGEDDTREVFRVTKYDKDWKRISAASLFGENTTVPFRGGCARMAHSGSTLVIRTCHEMYASSDGLNHQANVSIRINTDDMNVVDVECDLGISHSFNQFVIFDGVNFACVDHGDAYPRAISLEKIPEDPAAYELIYDKWAHYFFNLEDSRIIWDDEGSLANFDELFDSFWSENGYEDAGVNKLSFHGVNDLVKMLDISGKIGDNETGVSVGGFECTDTLFVVAGTTVNQEKFGNSVTRNIFISTIDRGFIYGDTPIVTKLTNYVEGQPSPSNPQLVKVNDDKFILMWTYKATSSDKNKVYLTELNGKGETVGKRYSFTGELSDCQPIVSDGKILWYVCDRNKIGFYSISTSDLSKNSVSEIYTQKPARVSDYGIEKLRSKSSIKFNWRAADRAATYVIKYSTDGKNWKTAAADSNTCTIKKLKPGTKYYIKIAAKNSAGTSDYCSVFTITTKKK